MSEVAVLPEPVRHVGAVLAFEEKTRAECLVHGAKRRAPVNAAACHGEAPLRDVATDDPDVPALEEARLVDDRGDGVDLLPRRATGAPDDEAPVSLVRGGEPRQEL